MLRVFVNRAEGQYRKQWLLWTGGRRRRGEKRCSSCEATKVFEALLETERIRATPLQREVTPL
jgi:hypothetical protein